MDLSTITPIERIVDVRHPATKKPTGLKLTVISDDDARVSAAKRRLFDAIREKGEKLTPEEEAAFNVSIQLTHVVGWEWSGDANFKGSKPAFSVEALREVADSTPIVRNAIVAAIRDDAGFYKG